MVTYIVCVNFKGVWKRELTFDDYSKARNHAVGWKKIGRPSAVVEHTYIDENNWENRVEMI